MKILLVNPPVEKVVTSSFPKCFHDIRGIQPPLGLLYIASYLKKTKPHCEIKIYDAIAEVYSEANFQKLLHDYCPDIVGVQIFTFTLLDAITIFKLAKQANSKTITVAGGPHVSLYHSETLQFNFVDYAVAGEGEIPFTQLVEYIENNSIDLNKIKGIGYKIENRCFINPEHSVLDNLDDIPVIDRELIPYRKYYSVFSRNKLMTAIITSRGCPHRCIYCSNFNNKVRAHSPQYVISEIKKCISLGIKEFFLSDDTFSFNIDRAKEICHIIIREKLDIKWYINTRINTIDDELLFLLKKSGCQRINYGIETGSQRIIKNIYKKINLEDAKKAIHRTKKAGMSVYCFFMIGLPGETITDIKETVKFIKLTKPDFAQFSITALEPGTKLYRMAIEKGIVDRDIWKEFSENPYENFRVPLWTENFSESELKKILYSLYKSFYLSPRFVIKNIFDKENWLNFEKTITAIYRIIKM